MAEESEVINIEEEGESSEFKEISLFEAVGDTVNSLAKCLGARIVPFFLSVISHFERLVDQKNNHYFKSLGVSTIAEVLRLTKLDPTPFIANLIRVVFGALTDKDPVTRSNAVFCSGIIMQNAGPNGVQYHLQVMDAICPSLRTVPTQEEPLLRQLRDNAAGATARMLLVQGSPLPLETVLPLWMAALPLLADFEEYVPVLEALAALLVNQQQRMVTSMPRVMETVVAAVAVNGKTTSSLVEPIKKVANVLNMVRTKFPADFNKLMSMLPQDCQAVILKLLA